MEKVCILSEESTFSVTPPFLAVEIGFHFSKEGTDFFLIWLENYVWLLYKKGLDQNSFLIYTAHKKSQLHNTLF